LGKIPAKRRGGKLVTEACRSFDEYLPRKGGQDGKTAKMGV